MNWCIVNDDGPPLGSTQFCILRTVYIPVTCKMQINSTVKNYGPNISYKHMYFMFPYCQSDEYNEVKEAE
jgi:hypothetical protein